MNPRTAPLVRRLAAIRDALLRIDELCPGRLAHRWKVCGKPTCRCAASPSARHGPYYEWSRLERRRLIQTALNRHQAVRMARAIRNYRRAERLLARWGRETARAILTADTPRP